MWLEETSDAVRDLNVRMDEDLFQPAKAKHASAQKTITQNIKSVDTTLTDYIRFYQPLKEFLVGVWVDFEGTTRFMQETLINALDNAQVARCLAYFQTALRWLSFLVFFIMGFVVGQTRTRTIRNIIRSPWASILFLPVFLGMSIVVVANYLLELPSTCRAAYIEGRLPLLASIVSKPFQTVLPPVARISSKVAVLVEFWRDFSVVMLLALPAASSAIGDYYKIPSAEEGKVRSQPDEHDE